MLFSRAGTTLAFLMLGQSDVAAAGGATAASVAAATTLSPVAGRIERLAQSFKRAYVLLPYEAADAAAALAGRWGAEPGLSFVVLPLCANATQQALDIAHAVLAGVTEEGAWRQQREQVVTSADAVGQVLAALPLPRDCDRAHTVNLLQLLGSLQNIGQQTSAEIMAHTGLPPAAAQQVEAFFRVGGQQAQPRPAAVQQPRPVLRSL
eukprot:scaffold4.g4890.t1